MIKVNNLYEEELKEIVQSLDMKSFRADQIYRAIHSSHISSIDQLNQLPIEDRDKLKESYSIGRMEIQEVFQSKVDETKKFLYKLEDSYLIEGVLLKYKHGYSLCVSTQVGCRMGCSFCASTVDGRDRDLEVFEIISQVYLVEDYFDISLSNIVLMGSGEPLDNYDNVIKALKILNNKKGRNLGLRNITLSTCGIASKIKELAQDLPQVGLAISLHSLEDDTRNEMMPVNKSFDIDTLLSSVRDYQKISKNRVSFEYTVIPHVNDRDKDIENIIKKLANIDYNINLIALNSIEDYNNENNDYKEAAKKFKYKLDQKGINNTLRRELGSDISASCGQLKKHYLKEGGR